jgi:hypothetical protein
MSRRARLVGEYVHLQRSSPDALRRRRVWSPRCTGCRLREPRRVHALQDLGQDFFRRLDELRTLASISYDPARHQLIHAPRMAHRTSLIGGPMRRDQRTRRARLPRRVRQTETRDHAVAQREMVRPHGPSPGWNSKPGARARRSRRWRPAARTIDTASETRRWSRPHLERGAVSGLIDAARKTRHDADAAPGQREPPRLRLAVRTRCACRRSHARSSRKHVERPRNQAFGPPSSPGALGPELDPRSMHRAFGVSTSSRPTTARDGCNRRRFSLAALCGTLCRNTECPARAAPNAHTRLKGGTNTARRRARHRGIVRPVARRARSGRLGVRARASPRPAGRGRRPSNLRLAPSSDTCT